MSNDHELHWKCNTPALLKEIATNPGVAGAPAVALQLFANILSEVAAHALVLNDPKLHALMCRLCLYEESDPYSKKYNEKKIDKIIKRFYP